LKWTRWLPPLCKAENQFSHFGIIQANMSDSRFFYDKI